jgi:hypothetical protein
MRQDDIEAGSQNEATGFSAFGGHLLAQAESIQLGAEAAYEGGGGGYVATLASLGIEDAEQLVAIAAIPDAREELGSALGLRRGELEELIRRAEGVLPRERAVLVSTAAPRDLGLGVLPPDAETLAALDAAAAELPEAMEAVALPGSVNLISFMQAIRNQRSRGTCVSFALTALNEYVLRRRGVTRDLSEQHLYYEIKLIDGSPAGCGTWQAKAVNALRTRGECREQVWPYNPNLPCNNHGPLPAKARPDGLNYRLSTVEVPARNVLAYKTHLSRQRPVTLSIPVYNSWYQSAETRRSGRITMRVGGEAQAGGHAVCLVGYQDSETSPGGGYFIVRNSWGTTWAYQSPYGAGYGTIPYRYITDEAWEAFTAEAAVPGEDDTDTDGDPPQPKPGSSTVTIEVSPNVKITIANA